MFTAINTPRRVLVVAPQWVGDAILSLPLLEQLANEYDQVDVLAVPAVESVYRCTAHVHRVVVAPFAHGQLQWRLRWRVARELRGQYCTAIVLPNSLKSALVPWLAGIPVRRGMIGESRFILLNQRIRPPTPAAHHNVAAQGHSARAAKTLSRAPMLDHYLALADHPIPAAAIDRRGAHRPRMAVPSSLQSATAMADGTGLPAEAVALWMQRPLLALCPGAEFGPAKQWPAEHFARVAKDWVQRGATHGVIVLGGPNDIAVGNAIATQADLGSALINLCGKTSLLQAFAWMAAARLAVSNDSGLMHAAAALNIPVVGLFGSSDPGHTPPHSPRARAVSLHLSCSPCFQRTCPLGTTACLYELMPDRVVAEINGLLADAQSVHA